LDSGPLPNSPYTFLLQHFTKGDQLQGISKIEHARSSMPFAMYGVLETERLIIRPISIQDAPFILQLLQSEGWLKYIGDRNVNHLDESRQYMADSSGKCN
jgi:RimJ/RimL family protein N-acetyltransferase